MECCAKEGDGVNKVFNCAAYLSLQREEE